MSSHPKNPLQHFLLEGENVLYSSFAHTCSRFVSCGTTPVHHYVIYGGEEPGMSAMGHGRDSSTHSIHRCREKRESSPFQRSVLTFHDDIVFNQRTLLGREESSPYDQSTLLCTKAKLRASTVMPHTRRKNPTSRCCRRLCALLLRHCLRSSWLESSSSLLPHNLSRIRNIRIP